MFGIKPEVITLFTPFFTYTDGRLLFNYGKTGVECWAPGLHNVPSTSEFWLAGAGHPNLVTHLYIGNSAAELLCFASQRAFDLLKYPEQVAFAAVGLLPSAAQVIVLKTTFPLGRSVSFRVNHDQVMIRYCGKTFGLECGVFSLSRFEQVTSLRAGIRTHKPPRGQSSFIEIQLPNDDP